METRDWLERTKASGIMSRDVVALRTTDPLQAAAELLMAKQISGAPVVDPDGVCVGVISSSDFLDAEENADVERRRVAESSFFKSGLALPVRVYEERMAEVRDRICPVAEQPVENFMTTNLVSVEEDAPLATVVQHLVNAHIHRVLVLNSENRLQGLITTTDILAAILRAGSEDTDD